jgi:nicotinamide-nucleotide amidase
MLEYSISKILINNKKTLAIAESCTGGLLSHTLTNIPGSSKFLKLGIIPYHSGTKVSILEIPKDILKSKGIVSKETAFLMAENVRRIAKSDFGIGITGIAGPSGQTKKTPVGTVCISVVGDKKSVTKKFLFKGNRLSVKKQAVESALLLLKKIL